MEKRPYYVYKDIDNRYSTRKERNKQKLYFRICNFVHGHSFTVININDITGDSMIQLFSPDDPNSVVVIEDIYSTTVAQNKWETIKNDDSVGITFDLYDVAICFKKNEMYKQHYKLNYNFFL